ncbi:MAG: glycosyltransferase family 4 protein [Nibricoccus sp.]
MPANPTVLHYVGADDDRGGIVSVIRALAATGRISCVLGVNRGGVQRRQPALPAVEFPCVRTETISPFEFFRTRTAARAVRQWLLVEPGRIFHGHTRAGMLVGLWLNYWGERRVVVSVHCFGRQRWFYRWAARQLGGRLYWLTPAMRSHYGVSGKDWGQCVPECFLPSETISERQNHPSGMILLAGVGFLVRWKGWHLVLEALALLPEPLRAHFQFQHIGAVHDSSDARNYVRELAERAAAAGIEKNIQWLGEQPSSAVLLSRSGFLVTASHNEPFSVAMLEALSAGVPVIAADSGGAQDIVRPPINGLLFRSGDAGDLSRVLRSLIETDALAKVRIDREALRRFSAPEVAAQWLGIYRCL